MWTPLSHWYFILIMLGSISQFGIFWRSWYSKWGLKIKNKIIGRWRGAGNYKTKEEAVVVLNELIEKGII